MSIILQGWAPAPGEPFAPLCGGYRLVPGPGPAALDWGDWWQSAQGWLPWPSVAAPAPALWWSWWWAAPQAVPSHLYRSGRGLAHGVYRYRSSRRGGRGGEDVAASPMPPTPAQVVLRSADRFVPFVLDFTPDVAPGDVVSAYTITVLAHPQEHEGTTLQDVTADLLAGQSSAFAQVTAILGLANAVPGQEYSVRVVAIMASGLTLEQTIGGGPQSRIVCDR